ncbi:MAG: hypothetical protein SFV81_13100, partial [Pirellulaceae bacterium]|nr:hypothetical protein [Pirellulaceae bacterium]
MPWVFWQRPAEDIWRHCTGEFNTKSFFTKISEAKCRRKMALLRKVEELKPKAGSSGLPHSLVSRSIAFAANYQHRQTRNGEL